MKNSTSKWNEARVAPAVRVRVLVALALAGDTLTDKPRGTGLGLPISREIVEEHGGRMWLESEVGRGSTFAFALPVAGAAEPHAAPEPEVPPAHAPASAASGVDA